VEADAQADAAAAAEKAAEDARIDALGQAELAALQATSEDSENRDGDDEGDHDIDEQVKQGMGSARKEEKVVVSGEDDDEDDEDDEGVEGRSKKESENADDEKNAKGTEVAVQGEAVDEAGLVPATTSATVPATKTTKQVFDAVTGQVVDTEVAGGAPEGAEPMSERGENASTAPPSGEVAFTRCQARSRALVARS